MNNNVDRQWDQTKWANQDSPAVFNPIAIKGISNEILWQTSGESVQDRQRGPECFKKQSNRPHTDVAALMSTAGNPSNVSLETPEQLEAGSNIQLVKHSKSTNRKELLLF